MAKQPADFLPALYELLEEVFRAGQESVRLSSAPLGSLKDADSLALVIPSPEEAFTREPPSPAWLPVIHAKGERPCGRPAFYLTQPFEKKKKADLSVMRIMPPLELQWKVPDPIKDAPQCSACGIPINPYTRDDLEWGDALIEPPTQDPAENPERTKRSKRRAPKARRATLAVTSPGLLEHLDVPSVPLLDGQPATLQFQEAIANLRNVVAAFTSPPEGSQQADSE